LSVIQNISLFEVQVDHGVVDEADEEFSPVVAVAREIRRRDGKPPTPRGIRIEFTYLI
jgi:hypothetical protein